MGKRRYGPNGTWEHPKWSPESRIKRNCQFLMTNEDHLQNLDIKVDENGIWPWPSEITKTFAISIRPERFKALQQRLGPWANKVTKFPGTFGSSNLRPGQRGWLSSGQAGCYNSHYRVWEVVSKMPKGSIALIMEDDASLFYHEQVSKRLRHFFDQLHEKEIPWHLCYLGNNQSSSSGVKVAEGIHTARPWDGLFCYLLRPLGAKLLLRQAYPLKSAVDTYVAHCIQKGFLKGIRSEPRFCFVVPVRSDTQRQPRRSIQQMKVKKRSKK